MAKKEAKTKIILERTYNVPLRKEYLKVPKYKRSKKAVSALKKFLKRHMKSNDIKIGKYLNLKIWEHGIKNPPHHVKINAAKDEKGLVRAELAGTPKEKKKDEKKKGKKTKDTEKKANEINKQTEKEIKGKNTEEKKEENPETKVEDKKLIKVESKQEKIENKKERLKKPVKEAGNNSKAKTEIKKQ